MKIELDNGKYTILLEEDSKKPYKFEALRHGEPWRNLVGDNLIYFLCQRIIEQENTISNQQTEIETLRFDLKYEKDKQ